MRRPELRTALLPLPALLLAGCALSLRPPPPAPPPVPKVVEVPAPAPAPLEFAAFVQAARGRAGIDLLADTEALLAKGEPLARLRAAIMLAQPQHPARDEARALAIAEDVARGDGASAQLREAAAMIVLWLDEQRRSETVARRAQARARDDEARIQALEQRLRDTEKRAADAEKKLEALRAIERDLSGRGANGRPERERP